MPRIILKGENSVVNKINRIDVYIKLIFYGRRWIIKLNKDASCMNT